MKMQAKTDRDMTPEMLESLLPTKKIKKIENRDQPDEKEEGEISDSEEERP